eukprot:TRINITY_DN8611_c0_g1_i1.p1 TRINITY_DN8611_c0_g1~~TRINITY_DN8611_c0_g1_i1.p1  ORF type:complete len:201 (+),score=46.50 TRINITY_DN8611_c0_g1_i1:519-1121(+)
MIHLTIGCNRAMRVLSGKEALDLLCKSERVYTDLNKSQQIYDEGDTIDLIVRQYREIPVQYEFRGFVCKNNLNALSQYFQYCYFEELQDEKDSLESKIVAFWESIQEVIPHEHYVIDFAIIDGDVSVIEINPFHYSTGAPFFSWKRDTEDREILLNGPFTFRIASEPMADAKERYMATCWVKYFEKKKPPQKKADDCIIS